MTFDDESIHHYDFPPSSIVRERLAWIESLNALFKSFEGVSEERKRELTEEFANGL